MSCGRSGDKKRVVKRDGSPGLCSTVGPSWTATCRFLHDIIALVSSSPDMTALGSLQQHQTATAKGQVKRWGRCESCEPPPIETGLKYGYYCALIAGLAFHLYDLNILP